MTAINNFAYVFYTESQICGWVVTLTYGNSSVATDAIGVLSQDMVSVAGISLILIFIIDLLIMRA